MKLFLIIITTSLISCSPALFVPTEKEFDDPKILSEMQSGRKLYVNHCSSCHALHLPNEFSDEKWEAELDAMQVKAKITNEERLSILNFILKSKQYSK